MALVKHVLSKFSAVISRASLLTSQTVGQTFARRCVPIRLHSHGIPSSQKSLIENDVRNDKQGSVTEEERNTTSVVISNVNKQIEARSHGRLFAVVYICGKQFKVTTEDLIVVEGYWPPTVGDKLKLEKILFLGSSDFSLIGRPLLPHGLVSIEATVIEKSMSHTKSIFKKKRRKQYMRINFQKSEYTTLRINSINITENVNTQKDVEGLERIF